MKLKIEADFEFDIDVIVNKDFNKMTLNELSIIKSDILQRLVDKLHQNIFQQELIKNYHQDVKLEYFRVNSTKSNFKV